ncbi:hypothetical protein MO867_19960 [Microbulbifer sp. OS29]|uniref:Uncharacterized protein n=1 Tax=Microbulbifer okhotskensis TaxID=2926617 RepID=A0A9X2ERR8_9GAMM|nr:hypothetical protein [Microbulbifer okhotskensis]MCO1336609.1 hypothetical protein [Microbulbifer okhotskensis]
MKNIRYLSLTGILFLVGTADLAAQRLAVPEYVSCDRNKLTSWQGEVTKLARVGDGIELWIATDYGTNETLKLSMSSWKKLLGQFRLRGKVFQSNDWIKLVDPKIGFRPKVYAVIWLCEVEGHPPVINWQPPYD